MSGSEDRTLSVLRMMAWERAKGELQAMMQTYYTSDNFEDMDGALETFIKTVEDNGWQEGES